MNIQQFTYDGRDVRIQIDENGKEWFCAMDVTSILGYADGRKALQNICKEKGVSKRNTLTKGGNQLLTYIDESNLFRLIVRSTLPKAQEFESFIFEEVLPTIRKTGSYSTRQAIPQTHLETARQLVSALEQIETLQPKANFYDMVTQSDDELDMNDVAKILPLGFGRNTLFDRLRRMGVLMQDNKPYQRYVDAGYFRCVEQTFVDGKGKIRVNVKTVVTQRGMDYIASVFQKKALAA